MEIEIGLHGEYINIFQHKLMKAFFYLYSMHSGLNEVKVDNNMSEQSPLFKGDFYKKKKTTLGWGTFLKR